MSQTSLTDLTHVQLTREARDRAKAMAAVAKKTMPEFLSELVLAAWEKWIDENKEKSQ